jgi:hypothetical protein
MAYFGFKRHKVLYQQYAKPRYADKTGNPEVEDYKLENGNATAGILKMNNRQIM